jgi:zinc/manganese transport system permease protein
VVILAMHSHFLPELSELWWMLIPFLACLVLSINHVYLGIHVIARKVIFVDLALAQIAALGATYALTLGYDPNTDSLKVSLFSLAFTFVGAGAFAIARMRREKIPQEAFIGIIYAAASAAAILILSKSATGGEELKHMLVGDVLLVSLPSVLNMVLLYGAIGIFHVIFRRKFLAISMDPLKAEASGINVRLWDILFYMSFGLVITKSVAIVGVLLVFSYLVVPAVIAQMWTDTVRGRLLLGWLAAILASISGILWSFYSDYPTGPAVVVMLGIFLIASSIIYYIRNSQNKFRAVATVAGLLLFGILFLGGLNLFKKVVPEPPTAKIDVVGMFLKELSTDNKASQLDSISHLQQMKDSRIVPALDSLLVRTQSDEVVEAIATALSSQKDSRAIPTLRKAAAGLYDYFLKLTIAEAQLNVGDKEGFATLIGILEKDDAGYARHQAIDLLEKRSGQKFEYNPEEPVTANAAALRKIKEWYSTVGIRLSPNAKGQLVNPQ